MPDRPAAPSIELSVVAPMYNEAANVERTLGLVRDALAGFPHPWEFVMVNDGSVDDTWEIARGLMKTEPRLRVVGYRTNRGRGMALRTGFAAARGRYVVTVDFDLSYSADHILRLYQALVDDPELDVVLGSAYMPGGETQGVDPRRLAVSRFGNRILSRAMGGRYHTITCVLRGYHRRVLEALDLESTGKEIHLEILSKCQALDFKVKEIPAKLTARAKGKSKFRFRGTALTHLAFAFAERPMLFFGATGALLATGGFAIGVTGLVLSIRGTPTAQGILWSLVVLLFLGGLQFLSFGFLALMIGGLRGDLYRLQRRVLELGGHEPPPEA